MLSILDDADIKKKDTFEKSDMEHDSPPEIIV